MRVCKSINDIAFIALTNGGYCVVDAELFPMLNADRWSRTPQGRIARNTNCYIPGPGRGGRRPILMHRVVNQTPEGIGTDHINGLTWDNRRCNLRTATNPQNHWNLRKRNGDYSSKYKGVYLARRAGRYDKWVAQICYMGKSKRLGDFWTEEEAARRYDQEALKVFGEFARLNFP